MKNTDDKILVQTCLDRNHPQAHDAFEILAKKYQTYILAVAINIVGSYDEALDVVQDTFVQVFINLERFDHDRNFKTWIIAIAVKRCLDHLKKRNSFLKYFQKKTQNNEPGDLWQLPGNKNLEDSEIFYPFLKKLKDKERIALILKINENYTAKEISSILSCSESTVRVYIFNAKQKLRKLMWESGDSSVSLFKKIESNKEVSK